MTLALIRLLANANTTEELNALLEAFKKSYDRADAEKDEVVYRHAQDSIQVIEEILYDRGELTVA